ncbi:hypothetical protein [Lunatimonas salinarum]|uniref:hypothetical protein n=1 Tax=Lunatimonas salinarum TaxID=1774590 RepID=UPI001AE04D4B|nr:hypothetical protein [Lunatimonas salinarum]
MRELSIDEMETFKGGGCAEVSKTAYILGGIGLAVGIAALFTLVGIISLAVGSQGAMIGAMGFGLDTYHRINC